MVTFNFEFIDKELPKMPGNSLKILIAIARHRGTGNKCWPGQDRLRKMSGLKRDAFRTAYTYLVEKKHIEAQQRRRKKGNRFTTNEYLVNVPGLGVFVGVNAERFIEPCTDSPHTDDPCTDEPCTENPHTDIISNTVRVSKKNTVSKEAQRTESSQPHPNSLEARLNVELPTPKEMAERFDSYREKLFAAAEQAYTPWQWHAKHIAAVDKLRKSLARSIRYHWKKTGKEDEQIPKRSILTAFDRLMDRAMKDNWLRHNFDPCKLNSEYNNLVSDAKPKKAVRSSSSTSNEKAAAQYDENGMPITK